jgi:hypothetical protein
VVDVLCEQSQCCEDVIRMVRFDRKRCVIIFKKLLDWDECFQAILERFCFCL